MKELKRKTVRGLIYPGNKQIAKWRGADNPYAGAYFQKAIRRDLGVGPEWYIHKSKHQCRLGKNVWYVQIEVWNISKTEWEKRKEKAYRILCEGIDAWYSEQERYNDQTRPTALKLYELELYPFHREVNKPSRTYHNIRCKADPTLGEMETYRRLLREEAWFDRVFEALETHFRWEVLEPRRRLVKERKAKDVEKLHDYALGLLRQGIPLLEVEAKIRAKFPHYREDKAGFHDLKIDSSFFWEVRRKAQK